MNRRRGTSAPAAPRETKPPASGDAVRWLSVLGAAQNNLKSIDVHIPLGRFVCVTGVSGSGKSSLVNDILREQLSRDLNEAEKTQPGTHRKIEGLEHLDKVIDIDQSAIGRTPRSNPATYIKVFDEVRDLYAKLPDAKVRGYKPGRFSFNVPTGPDGGGRCEACEGNGSNRVEMDFLADVWVMCPVCEGRRFARETLHILFKGMSIADVLNMDVQEALTHFANVPKIAAMLQTLHDVGLDYLKLGQSSTTLSGGEAQRIKLARELVKKSTGRTMYLLDEPTTGLHFADIKRLLAVLHGFVDAGNSVVVIEHNLDVIKTADWVIDLGPEGGEGGGRIVAEGTPEEVAAAPASYTGLALRPVLGGEKSNPGAPGRKVEKSKSRGSRNPKSAIRNHILVVGAKQHNLKDITVTVPRGETTVCCGLSGSGKSSFAIDTVYTEGQRRYVESLSAYARQFLGQMQKPKVDHIEGLSPAICIEQKAAANTPRSTVGTVTEIYDYMRVLWARVGTPYCPRCRVPVGSQSAEEIVERVMQYGEGTKVMLLAPVAPAGQESFEALLARQKANGFVRVRVDGVVHSLDQPITLDARRKHAVELVVDRIVVKRSNIARITDSVEQTLALGNGVMKVVELSGDQSPTPEGWGTHPPLTTHHSPLTPREQRFSQLHSCGRCGKSYDELTPHHFSFNASMGWCKSCEGLGTQRGASSASIVVRPTASLVGGAVAGWDQVGGDSPLGRCVQALADRLGFDSQRPWNQLAEDQRRAFLQGGDDEWIAPNFARLPDEAAWRGVRIRWKGFYPSIDRATRVSWQYRKRLEEMVTDVPCETCAGSRLKPEPRSARLADQTIHDACAMPLSDALAFFESLKLDARRKKIAGELLHEITARLRFLVDVGLGYMTLHRSAPTLSGGESQRIRLASQIGSGLTGVLYVLDEPTVGLHPRDNARLIAALAKLRNLGNTVLMVEHDREVIASADHVLDFGPGAGAQGGEVVATGTPKRIAASRSSPTGAYISGREAIAVPSNRRVIADCPGAPGRIADFQKQHGRASPLDQLGTSLGHATPAPGHGTPRESVPAHWLVVRRAYENNLKEIDAAFPLGRFTCVTGVSGSGKSSLVTEIVYKALAARIHRARLSPGAHAGLEGIEHIDKVINVDQDPIGNSPSSNPATYTGVLDLLRELFARLPDSKVRGYGPNRFSFNRPGGRCEACEGNGQRCIEMHFLPDVWVTCEACNGSRYNRETLEVRYKGKSISDALELSVAEALVHFGAVPKVRRMLKTLDDVGLGYVRLGQAAPTLSGGEAQRVKLAAELGRPSTGKTLYILDEPTTGLHFADIRKLLEVLQRLTDLGNTVICVEHNLEVIKCADWVIDLGPEAGEAGGRLVICGDPEVLASCSESHTGRALKPILDAGPRGERRAFDPKEQARAELELQKPVTLEADGPTARLPWQLDGRKWHTVNHVGRNGKPVHWDPKLLIWWVDTIEELGGFEPANWNDRARVEIKAAGAKSMWFMHALTGGPWLLEITVRTPAGTFDDARLRKQLGVKTLDERSDMPIYGQWPRVSVRKGGQGNEDVRLYLHDFKDVNKPVFETFLRRAAEAHLGRLKDTREAADKGEPWKSDGKQWHLSQRGVRERHAVQWKPTTLVELIGRISKAAPGLHVNWNGKCLVGLRAAGRSKPFGRIVTNQGSGLRVEIQTPRGAFTAVRVEPLGRRPEIVSRADHDVVQFWVQQLGDSDAKILAEVVRAALADHGALVEAAS